MKVYIVMKNNEPDRVFSMRKNAEDYAKENWSSTIRIIEREVEDV